MRRFTILPLLFAMALAAAPASAQQLSLTIRDGLVNLDAQGASIRQILDAWSRIGGTNIVNGERVNGGPVTLKLTNTPERQALDIILRSAAGYMAVPRAANGTAGDSMFDRIMVLPTSSAPQNARGPAQSPQAPSNPFLRGGRAPQADDEEPAVAEEPEVAQPPVFTFPNQENAPANQFGGPNQAPAPFGQPAQGAPFGQPAQGAPFGQPAQPAQTSPFGQAPANNPFAPTPVPAAPPNAPFGQPAQQPVQTPFGQVQQPQSFGQQQTPAVNPFAAALSAAQQQQQQQQQQQYPNMAAPAPGTFQIIGSPTPGVTTQPQPTPPNPFQRPPGQK